MNTRPESLELQLPYTPPPPPILRSPAPIFFLSGFLPCPLPPYVPLSSLCGAHSFPSLGSKLLWALWKVGRAWGKDASGGDWGRGSVLGPGEDGLMLVGGDGHYQLSGHSETDRMDFLRLHLPGLHQALRGALVRGAKRCQRLLHSSPGPHLPSSL